MNRIVKEFFTVCQFHQISQIHYANPVTDMFHHRKVMSNEQICQPSFFLKFFQKIYNLCLNRNIQRGNRFITYDKIRIYCQRTGNSHTLPLSTRKFMRKTIRVFCLKSYCFKQTYHLFFFILALLCKTMRIQALPYDIHDFSSWIQRCIRILKDHLHSSSQLMCLFPAHAFIYFHTIKGNGSRCRLIKMNHCSSKCRFSTSGLSNKPESLSFVNLKCHIIHSF